MLSNGRDFLFTAPHIAMFRIAMSTLVIGLNMFGDGLRDALDPRLKNRKGIIYANVYIS